MAGEKFQRENRTEDLEKLAPQIKEIDTIWGRLNRPPEYWPDVISSIVEDVADKHGLAVTDLWGARRQTAITTARYEASYRCATETNATYMQIGKALKKHHTSVIHGVRRHAEINGLPLPRGMK